MSSIADRIRSALRARKLTQRELGRRAGMAETQIGVLLHRLKDNPLAVELSTLRRITDAADVDFDWLVTGRVPDDGTRRAHRLADHLGWSEAIEYLTRHGPPIQPALLTWLADASMDLPPDLPLDWGFLRELMGAYVFWSIRQQPDVLDRSVPRPSRAQRTSARSEPEVKDHIAARSTKSARPRGDR